MTGRGQEKEELLLDDWVVKHIPIAIGLDVQLTRRHYNLIMVGSVLDIGRLDMRCGGISLRAWLDVGHF